MKRYVYMVFFMFLGAVIFGILGFLKLVGYGASDCDMPGKSCDCFCCNSFGLRGYEACGNYGFLVGVVIGLAVGLVVYFMIKRINLRKQKKVF